MSLFLDKIAPNVWADAQKFSLAVGEFALQHGLGPEELELIKVRASQINGCAYCLDLHTREARQVGVPQQKIDLLPAWRESALYAERETAVLAIAEAATQLPLSENSRADLAGARGLLGDEAFGAAEWVAAAINLFNRVSILSEHPVRARDADGKIIR